METMQRNDVFWPYLIAWAVMAAAFAWRRWAPGIQLSGVTLTGFLVTMAMVWFDRSGYEILVAVGVGMGAASVLGLQAAPQFEAIWRSGVVYAFITVFIGLWALQFVRDPQMTAFILLAGLALLLTIAAIWWGLSAPDRLCLWLGYIGFSAEILAIYSKTIGTLMGSSLFFLSAGLIVAALAYLAYRLHARGETLELQP